MMDEQTALLLALQLVALFAIAGALVVYLLCKVNVETDVETVDSSPGGGNPVLITSCDNAIGLQLALHLANRGYRVFAGLRDAEHLAENAAARIIRVWQKQRESSTCHLQGALIALQLDVNREDLLHESVDIIRAHLPAGQDGLWAVINTSGVLYRGRIEHQDVSHWEATMKTNVVGLLRVARTFQSLLRNTSGRIITLGEVESSDAGLVAYTASRYAVQGASNALRKEVAPMGIAVVALNATGLSQDCMLASPKLATSTIEVAVDLSDDCSYQPIALPSSALRVCDEVLSCKQPKDSYELVAKPFIKWSRLKCF